MSHSRKPNLFNRLHLAQIIGRDPSEIQNSSCHITKRTQRQKRGKLQPRPSISMSDILCSYSLTDGASSFAKQAHRVTFDLTNDEGKAERSKQQTWDKKRKKFIKGDGVGADNIKMVRTENGTRLPATFRSGRFDEWKSKSRVTLPRIGEAENPSQIRGKNTGPGGHRFKHTKVVEAKPLDKLSKDYERKVRQLKKKNTEDGSQSNSRTSCGKGTRRGGKTYSRVKTELKTSQQIRKDRKLVANRRAKNARPSRSNGKKGKH